MTHPESMMVARQEPLRARYREAPEDALIVERAHTGDGPGLDPVHGRVVPGHDDYGVTWSVGIHRAVGGDHDQPNPGDMLTAALAVCLDTTIRMIADRHGVVLERLRVDAASELDVRGTLMVGHGVPVGFQRMRCVVTMDGAPGTPPQMLRKILTAAVHSCVTLQTLRAGVPIETELKAGSDAPERVGAHRSAMR